MKKNPELDYKQKYIIRYMNKQTILIGKIISQTTSEIHYDCIYIIKGSDFWLSQKDIRFSISRIQGGFEYIDELGVFREML
jgi:hypothetical protein